MDKTETPDTKVGFAGFGLAGFGFAGFGLLAGFVGIAGFAGFGFADIGFFGFAGFARRDLQFSNPLPPIIRLLALFLSYLGLLVHFHFTQFYPPPQKPKKTLKTAYLDNAATTEIYPEVVEVGSPNVSRLFLGSWPSKIVFCLPAPWPFFFSRAGGGGAASIFPFCHTIFHSTPLPLKNNI